MKSRSWPPHLAASNTAVSKRTASSGRVLIRTIRVQQFLHRDGVFTHGKGIFNPVDWKPPAEVADKEYPFVLSTGRRLYHYHTRTQTGRSGMDLLMSEETADISQADAQRLGIQPEEYVKVRSRRGEVKVKARVTEEVPPGMVWMSFHFRDGSANWLTNAVYDPNTFDSGI